MTLLFFAGLTVVLISGFVFLASSFLQLSVRSLNKVRVFSTAEAGIEYYRWHLAHAPQDFKDGTGNPGPYIHSYYDKDGILIGNFSLTITPPPAGSTVVTIRSSGSSVADPSITKVIEVKMAIPSLARFSVVANADIRFGAGTEVYGPLHSNGGIRFDGVAYNSVTSAKASYDDPDHSGGNEFGVHTHTTPVDPLPPASVPARTDVFKAGREFPVPAVDFNGITQDLANIKAAASSSGYYKGPSGAKGYELILKTNDTFDLHKVTAVISPPNNCVSNGASGWGTWSIQTTSSVAANVAFPANGLIFIEDDLWVRGQINTARLTIAAGRFPVNPTTYASITTNNDVLYTNYDSQDVISLMAQKNMNVGLKSEDDLKMDAALVAQNGRVGRYYYSSYCGSEYRRSKISSYGMIATSQRYGWAYTDGTGYQTRIITYDANLLYAPPPSFPLTTDQYSIISWNEIQ